LGGGMRIIERRENGRGKGKGHTKKLNKKTVLKW